MTNKQQRTAKAFLQAMLLAPLLLLAGSRCSFASEDVIVAGRDTDPIPVLHRGTNIAAWLTGPNRHISERDILEIKSAGFDFVRLPVDPKLLHFALDGDVPVSQQLDFTAV